MLFFISVAFAFTLGLSLTCAFALIEILLGLHLGLRDSSFLVRYALAAVRCFVVLFLAVPTIPPTVYKWPFFWGGTPAGGILDTIVD